MLSPGDTIDRYAVEAIIGSGGTAVVYRVRHQQLGTKHALKVLSVTSDIIRQRMLTEGRVQAALDHVNVVGVSDVLDVNGAPGLLMECIDGPPLDKALDKYRINQKSAETLFLGIAAGVRQAHLQGLVHRDLKPANVLLARTSDGFVPKVTDFGLAKVLEDVREGHGHTRSGIALGTPAYMAPEQIRDARTVDQRADVFALGCILYELMTRRRAFPGDDTIAIYNHILDGRVVPPRHYVPDLEDRLDTAIRGALVVDRENRIPDVDTLIAVLAGEVAFEVVEPTGTDDVELVPADEELSIGGNRPDLPLAISRTGEPTRSRDPLWASIHDPSFRGGLPQGPRPTQPSKPDAEPEPAAGGSGLLFLGGAGLVFVLALMFAVIGTSAALVTSMRSTEDPGATRENESIAAAIDAAPADEPLVTTQTATELVPEPVAVVGTAGSEAAAPRPAPRPSVRPAPAPKPAPPEPAVVTVKILTSPPIASLVVDGTDHGRTPAKLTLGPGPHTVEVRSGDDVGTFAIDVSRQGENKWCYSFGEAASSPGSCR